METVLVTGGAGFIGSHLVDELLAQNFKVVCLDKLTYAGSLNNIQQAQKNTNFVFVKGCILDEKLVADLLRKYNVSKVFHLAAESHVDNSIIGPKVFYETNVMGTFNMVWQSYLYWQEVKMTESFRFIHVSTDEVYGELPLDGVLKFNETTSYAPNSAYSASKASSNFAVRAMAETYKMPCIITNCSNNYGSRQHGEKLIPTVIRCCLNEQEIPVYGTGENVRDWLYVEDHVKALIAAGLNGDVGETYCIGGNNEYTNLNLVKEICTLMDELNPRGDSKKHEDLITFVTDRKGHDKRYAIDFTKAQEKLNFTPSRDFKKTLKETILSEIKKGSL